jgi:hypothetical protein
MGDGKRRGVYGGESPKRELDYGLYIDYSVNIKEKELGRGESG